MAKSSRVEKAIEITSGIALILGALLMSPNITGNITQNIGAANSSFVGTGLLSIGLLGALIYLIKRRQNRTLSRHS